MENGIRTMRCNYKDYPKNPDPSKVAKFEDGPLPYRFKPLIQALPFEGPRILRVGFEIS